MAKIRQTRYFTHLMTCSYKRIVPPFLKNRQILQFEAIRNRLIELPVDHKESARWLTNRERRISDLDINFNTKDHGTFSSEKVEEFIKHTDARDFWVKSMTLLVDDDDVGKAAAALLKVAGVPSDSISVGEKYVAYLESTPCRRFSREEKTPQWIERVLEARTLEEQELGFEPGVLDLVWVLPLDEWSETEGKKRISRAYQAEIARLKEALNVHNDASFSRHKIMNSLFPKSAGIVGGRVEALMGKDTWVIVGFE